MGVGTSVPEEREFESGEVVFLEKVLLLVKNVFISCWLLSLNLNLVYNYDFYHKKNQRLTNRHFKHFRLCQDVAFSFSDLLYILQLCKQCFAIENLDICHAVDWIAVFYIFIILTQLSLIHYASKITCDWLKCIFNKLGNYSPFINVQFPCI